MRDDPAMAGPAGFAYVVHSDGTVVITRHGRLAATLRGPTAARFLAATGVDDQLLMARATGNYRRGNERVARRHPRNRGER